MPDKLFDVVLAELQKIPHVKITGTYQNRFPLKMYGGITFDDAGQIVVDFDKARRKKLGLYMPWENGTPLAKLEDVREGLRREVGLPRSNTEYLLVYLRPAFDGDRYVRGRLEVVVVGTQLYSGYPFSGYPDGNGHNFNVSELIDRHSEI